MRHGTITEDTRKTKYGATDETSRTEPVTEVAHVKIRASAGKRVAELLFAQDAAAAGPVDETDVLELMAAGREIPGNLPFKRISDLTEEQVKRSRGASFRAMCALRYREEMEALKAAKKEAQDEEGPKELASRRIRRADVGTEARRTRTKKKGRKDGGRKTGPREKPSRSITTKKKRPRKKKNAA